MSDQALTSTEPALRHHRAVRGAEILLDNLNKAVILYAALAGRDPGVG